jgi:hypothetical protein
MVNYPYDGHGPLTPDVVAEQVDPDDSDSFRAAFEDARRVATAFLNQYPDIASGGAQ